MMQRLSRFLLGTASVRVTGDTTRFLNVIIKSGITPLKVERSENALLLTLRPRQFRALHAAKLRCGTVVRLTARRGLPFILHRARRRPGFLLGGVLAAAFYLFLSGFIWGVSVEGEAPYSTSEMLAAAAECGAYEGAAQGELNAALASVHVMRLLPKLSSASFNTNGCFVTLSVRTALTREEGAAHDGAFDIVAKRDGIITGVTAEAGEILVQPGSAVTVGQRLVSGVTVVGDPYDDRPEIRLLSHARASVYAETQHIFSASCPLILETTREAEAGENRALNVLGVRIPLALSGIEAGAQRMRSSDPLVLLGVELPVKLETERGIRLEPVTVEFTREEAERRALERMHQLRENILGETGRVLREEVRFAEADGIITVYARCTCEEDIAEAVPLTYTEEPEP